MMAAILNSAMLDSDTAILDSDTLLSSLRLTQKHSSSTLTLTQTNSIWLTGWWQPSWILPSWIQPCCTKLWLNLNHSDSKSFILTQLDDGSHLELCHLGFSHFAQKKTSLIHSDSTWWWQPSWNLPCWIQTLPSWIQTPCHQNSQINSKTLPPLTLTQLIQSDSTWWWQPSWILPSWIQPCCTKLWLKNTLNHLWLKVIHSDSTWWWQPSWILPSWIQPFCTKKTSLTQTAFWLNLMMAAILNSAMLDSDTAILDSNTLLSSLRLTQKHSSSTLNLTQTNSIWLT